MAEKNTHSILESIKKKLNKFDQKPENTIDGFDELDYSAPEKKEEPRYEAIQDLNQNSNSENSVNEDPLVSLDKIVPNSNRNQFDDSDLDDEASIKPVLEKVAANTQNSGFADFSSDELENSEDEIDFSLDVDDALPKQSENASSMQQDQIIKADSIDLESVQEEEEIDFDKVFGKQPDQQTQPKVVENSAEEKSELDFTNEEIEEPKASLSKEILPENTIVENTIPENSIPESSISERQILESENVVQEKSIEADLDFDALNDELSKMINESSKQEENLKTEVDNKIYQKSLNQNLEAIPVEVEITESQFNQNSTSELKNSSSAEIDELELEIQRQKDQIKEDSGDDLHLELEKEFLGLQKAAGSSSDNDSAKQSFSELPKEIVNNESFNQEFNLKTVDIKTESQKPVNLIDNFDRKISNFSPIVDLSAYDNSTKVAPEIGSGFMTQKPLLNDVTVKQTTDSVRKLLDAKNIVSGVSNFSQSPILAELATQLLEPKLEKWLNEHLSELVEQIVREEIKKIIPKGD